MKRILFLATTTSIAFLICIGLFAAMLLTASSAYADAPNSGGVNETRAATANASVQVSNIAGSVTVQGWNNNRVQVTGTLSGGVTLDFHGSADDLEIRAVYPEYSGGNSGAELTIHVPVASRLSVNTVSADIGASGLSGRAQLGSVSGDVTLTSKDSDARVKSVSGDVTLTGSASGAQLSAHSISGDVNLSGLSGNLSAGSISGHVQMSGQNTLTGASISTTSGNVDFHAALTGSGNYDFHSTSGDLHLSFTKTPDARFDISSFSGDINNNFGPQAQRTREYGPGVQLHFTSGQGDAQVTARTLSGNITLSNP